MRRGTTHHFDPAWSQLYKVKESCSTYISTHRSGRDRTSLRTRTRMATTSRIVTLSSAIEQNTRIIDAYFTENGLPSPSLEASTPPDLPLPPQIVAAKDAALEAMDELQVLLLGPMPKIFHDLIHIVSAAYRRIIRLG
jgi:hypothetical protein